VADDRVWLRCKCGDKFCILRLYRLNGYWQSAGRETALNEWFKDHRACNEHRFGHFTIENDHGYVPRIARSSSGRRARTEGTYIRGWECVDCAGLFLYDEYPQPCPRCGGKTRELNLISYPNSRWWAPWLWGRVRIERIKND
jgi:hypothetical protein